MMPSKYECRENLWVWTSYHPYYESLNKKIILESLEYNWFGCDRIRMGGGGLTNVKALQTPPSSICSPSVKIINEWVLDLLVNDSHSTMPLTCHSSWVAKYNRGDYTLSHLHTPAAYGYVYFVKSPKGSSPLVFTTSGKKIKPEEGKVVIFPGNMNHHVPKNRCDDRIVVAGNIVPKHPKL
tara:strand:- start:52 stop:594 length:543 start_codon:yes stop_codon:yes gene_type:complete